MIELAFLFAAFINFLDFTFQEGNIFDWYRKFLIDKFYIGTETDYSIKEELIESKWYKVLGGCKYCYQAWIAIPFYISIVGSGIIYYFLFIGLVFTFISFLDYLENFFNE